MHVRHTEPRHRFTQPILMLLLDLDTIGRTARQARLFSHNGFNLFAFSERDHGARDGTDLLNWIRTTLHDAGYSVPDGPVYMLAQPRILGYVFNPLSIYFCHDSNQLLRALIYQVHNTYGEEHAYVIELNGTQSLLHHFANKAFRVSPFLPMSASYEFRLKVSDNVLNLNIGVRATELTTLFNARLDCKRRPFTDWNLLKAFMRRPISPQRAHLAIYRQAAMIWMKGRAGSWISSGDRLGEK